jgi:hypothetical protein
MDHTAISLTELVGNAQGYKETLCPQMGSFFDVR